MDRTYLIALVFLFAGVVSAGELSTDQITKLGLRFEPSLSPSRFSGTQSSLSSHSSIKGRLLTPKEGCGYSNVTNTKIVGGSISKKGAFPWMALLGYRSRGSYFSFNCGGSLITSKHVLTAAHCINNNLELVRLGEHDLMTEYDGKHEDISIRRVQEHPNYSKTDMRNDIAVLTLIRDVEFSDRIRPICLPVNGMIQFKDFVGTNPFVAGWGTTKEDGFASNILREVQVPVLDNRVCKVAFDRIDALVHPFQFSSTVLCAGHLAGGKDSCQGDSGGPLMLPVHEGGEFPFYQIGVVSYGIGCANRGLPGVYANVPYFADWIKSKILY